MLYPDLVVAASSRRQGNTENNLEPELPALRLIQLTEGLKSHVSDTD